MGTHFKGNREWGHIFQGKKGKRAHISGVPSRGHRYHFYIIIISGGKRKKGHKYQRKYGNGAHIKGERGHIFQACPLGGTDIIFTSSFQGK